MSRRERVPRSKPDLPFDGGGEMESGSGLGLRESQPVVSATAGAPPFFVVGDLESAGALLYSPIEVRDAEMNDPAAAGAAGDDAAGRAVGFADDDRAVP